MDIEDVKSDKKKHMRKKWDEIMAGEQNQWCGCQTCEQQLQEPAQVREVNNFDSWWQNREQLESGVFGFKEKLKM